MAKLSFQTGGVRYKSRGRLLYKKKLTPNDVRSSPKGTKGKPKMAPEEPKGTAKGIVLLQALISKENIQLVQHYASSIAAKIMQGDPLYVALALIAAVLVLGILIEVTFFIWRILKRVVLVGVIGSSLYLLLVYLSKEFEKYPTIDKVPPSLLAFGVIGLIIGVIALYIAIKALVKRVRPAEAELKEAEVKAEEAEEIERRRREVAPKPPAPAPAFTLPVAEKSLLSVLAYIIVGEFGVFSGVTVAAPNPIVGIAFMGAFMVGALLFLRNTYTDYLKGLKHLIVASIFAVALSIVLGHYWALIPLEKLLSINYFATPSAVAVVTGIAVSLLLGSKG